MVSIPPSTPLFALLSDAQLVGTLSAGPLSAQQIGQLFYAQTAAESAVNVTPSNYAYAPGNVLRYGADPTGTTDSSVAFQAAINSNSDVYDGWPGGGKYLFSTNTVQINNYPLMIRGQVRWPGSRGAAPLNGSQIIVGSALGSLGAFTANQAVYGLRLQNWGFSFQALTQNQAAFTSNNDLRYSIIEGCTFIGGVGTNCTGISLTTSDVFTGDVVIRDNFFNTLSIGVNLAGSCTTVKLTNNEFYGHTGVNAINSFGVLTGGSGYTSGTYNNIALTGGTGTGAIANITVAGGIVTVVTLVNGGTGYANTDTLSASGLGSGTLFSIAVATVGNLYGTGVSLTAAVSGPVLTANYFEGFTTGVLSAGATFLSQIGNEFGANVNHFNWYKTTAARIWNTSIGDSFAGTGNVIYSTAITDNCVVLSQGYYFLGGNVSSLTVGGTLGINGATPPAQVTGWGTPTAGAVVNNFPGSSATTAQCGSAISELLAIFKNMGIIGG